ncbi:orange carotenoid protein N-terminal domain-containing protein [Microcoleus sp. FACHB-68]|uniref:orange carotenoid protein N-terminal domain-containing protein n=1 Tax=Microcoleus sp. FACHB-68 TaxID=2692826 RepID=UPI00168337C4|nr:orange carotenoid protein N-terminal domain-containing protein [Microcoleus sp. FACHB-68]MBD1940613.1 orange carotenoid protein [Microcoleus sp. FACHB-68]
MTSNNPSKAPEALSKDTQNVAQRFESLGTDDKLALLYYIYKKMGGSITPAAPDVAQPELAPMLLGDFFELSDEEQLNIMRAIVNREDTEFSHAYGSLTANNQLVVWFAWSQAMGDTVVDMPGNYQANQATNDVLGIIEKLNFEEQITVLREIAGNMGYTSITRVTSQETGVTPSL